ncbi:LysM peptidoglycan-binding domain-containing protein [Micrococcus sp. KRD026]|uniref:lytic transglycosylase n=1 Tax=Micrococcus sp. KRD026 TaxID=2729718 RepID=UPI0004490949|nr:LysM domain protein [Micrococcus luteus]MCV7486944.1 LysM peptidoglycan-binding domain-containing protein [Micrococcus luteus]
MVSGDSLWGISQRFEVSIPRLRELNGLTRASTLHPGDVLVISDGTLEVEPVSAVQAVGDTFLGRTYAPHVTASANENLRLLRSVPQPTPEQMQQIVRETAERMGVDPRLALGHAYTESRFRMASVSPGNAVGAMQVIPITGEFASELVGRELNLLDPHDNAVAGVAFIKYVQDRTPTLDEGIGAYYQGLGGVLDSGLNPEARDYVAKVRAAMAMF